VRTVLRPSHCVDFPVSPQARDLGVVAKVMRQLRIHRATDQPAHQLFDQAARAPQVFRLAVPLSNWSTSSSGIAAAPALRPSGGDFPMASSPTAIVFGMSISFHLEISSKLVHEEPYTPGLPMDLTGTHEEANATDLARVGAEVDFAVQRLAYLRQYPDGRPGQPFVLNNAVAFSMAMMLGTLLDLILDVSEGRLPRGRDFIAELTDDGMDLTVRIQRGPDESRPGYKVLKDLAYSVTVDADKHCLVIRMSAASINARFPRLDPGVCPPSIAG
jgi:hypothetical protein